MFFVFLHRRPRVDDDEPTYVFETPSYEESLGKFFGDNSATLVPVRTLGRLSLFWDGPEEDKATVMRAQLAELDELEMVTIAKRKSPA